MNEEKLIELLKEAYGFIGMPHKALNPWRIALDDWKKRVEDETKWNHFHEVQKFKFIPEEYSTEQDESSRWCYAGSVSYTLDELGDDAWQTGYPLCGDNCLLEATPADIKECELYFENYK